MSEKFELRGKLAEANLTSNSGFAAEIDRSQPSDVVVKQTLRRSCLKNSLIFSFSLIGQVGFATALPLVIFGILGRYLDKIYNTGHWFFFAGLLIATIQVFFYLRYIVSRASERVGKIS